MSRRKAGSSEVNGCALLGYDLRVKLNSRETRMREVLWLVIDTVGSLIAAACMLRLWMVWLGMSMRDPVGHFVFTFTEWLVRPLRKVLPRGRHFDWSCLLGALLIALVLSVAFTLLFALHSQPKFGAVVLLAVVWLLRWTLWLLVGALLLLVILSWVNPHAPIAPMLEMLTRPVLEPIRRRLPRIGGLDLSPLVVILLAQIALTVLRTLHPFA
jgi:YggT family protein